MSPTLATTVEGDTTLLVPADSLTKRTPDTHPVFFNPAARLNRDISVAFASVVRPKTYLDALAGTGARGVRIAKETWPGVSVTMVDFNRASLSLASRNVKENKVSRRCKVVHSEANAYLYSRFERDEKFEAVDLDPFGTPAPYIQAGLVASGDDSLFSFTATDAAVLCGVYPAVALRRYGSAAPRSEFVHETAIRVLAGFAARMGGVNDIGVEPVAAHSTLHYLRVYLRVKRGVKSADLSQDQIGYVWQCNKCQTRQSGRDQPSSCSICGSRVKAAGPMWVGPLCDEKLVQKAAQTCADRSWPESNRVLVSLAGFDRFPPFSYSLERAASRLRSSSVQMGKVIDRLESVGFKCIRQPFEENSLKTDAGVRDLERAMKDAL